MPTQVTCSRCGRAGVRTYGSPARYCTHEPDRDGAENDPPRAFCRNGGVLVEEGDYRPLLIVADNYRLAHAYAREHDLGREREEWRYVATERDTLGLRGPGRFVRVSTGEARGHDLNERIAVARHLRLVGFTSEQE